MEGKMSAIELHKADGTTAGIFYCSQCRIVRNTQEETDRALQTLESQ